MKRWDESTPPNLDAITSFLVKVSKREKKKKTNKDKQKEEYMKSVGCLP
jgi:hypothetical protein